MGLPSSSVSTRHIVYVALIILLGAAAVTLASDEHELTRYPHSLNAHVIESSSRAGKGVSTHLHTSIHRFRDNETSYALSIHTTDFTTDFDDPLWETRGTDKTFAMLCKLTLFNEAGKEWKFDM